MLKIDKEKSIMTITTVRDGRFLKIRGQEVEYCLPDNEFCLPDNENCFEAIIEKDVPVQHGDIILLGSD
jgi:hypothetical protein